MNAKSLRYTLLAAVAVFLTAAASAQINRDSENVAAGTESEAKIKTWASEELLDIVDRLPGILSTKHTPNHRSREYQEEAAELEDLLESAKPDAEIVRIWDYGKTIETTWYSPYRFAFLRVGGRYAKILFMFSGTIDGRAKEVDSGEPGDVFRAYIYYDVYLNPEKGDRKLKEYY